jgi:hypothetical protein
VVAEGRGQRQREQEKGDKAANQRAGMGNADGQRQGEIPKAERGMDGQPEIDEAGGGEMTRARQREPKVGQMTASWRRLTAQRAARVCASGDGTCGVSI